MQNQFPPDEPPPSVGDYVVFFGAVAIMAVVVGILVADKLL